MTNSITIAQTQDPFRPNSSQSESTDLFRANGSGAQNITLVQGKEIDFGKAILNKDISVDGQNKILKIKHSDGRTVEISYTEQSGNSYSIAGRILVINNKAPEEGVQLILSKSAKLNNITKLGMNDWLDITFNGKTIKELDAEVTQAQAENQQKTQEVSFDSQQLIQSAGNTTVKIGVSVAGTSFGGIVGGFLGSFIPIPGVGTALGVAVGSAAGAFASNIFGQTVIDKREVNWWEAGVDGTIAGATGGLSKYFTIATKAGKTVPTLVRAVVGNGSIITRAATNGLISTSSGIVIRATDTSEDTEAFSLSSMAFDGLSGALIGEASHQVGRKVNFRETKPTQTNPAQNTTTVTFRQILPKEPISPKINNPLEITVDNNAVNTTNLSFETPPIIQVEEPSASILPQEVEITHSQILITKPTYIVKAEIGQTISIPETPLKVVISQEGGAQHFRLSRENRADSIMKGSSVKADGKLENTVTVRPGTKEDLAVKEGDYIRIRSSKNNEVTTYMVKRAKPSSGDFELEKVELKVKS